MRANRVDVDGRGQIESRAKGAPGRAKVDHVSNLQILSASALLRLWMYYIQNKVLTIRKVYVIIKHQIKEGMQNVRSVWKIDWAGVRERAF